MVETLKPTLTRHLSQGSTESWQEAYANTVTSLLTFYEEPERIGSLSPTDSPLQNFILHLRIHTKLLTSFTKAQAKRRTSRDQLS